MKKVILAIAMVACSATSFAQHEVGSINIQPKVGFNATTYDKLEDYLDRDFKAGFSAGVEAEYRMSNTFALSAGAFYSQKGVKVKGKDEFKDIKMTCEVDYIDVPILANFYVWKGLALKIGLQPAFKVRDNTKMDTPQGAYDRSSFDHAYKSFDLCLPIGVSYDFGRLSVELRSSPGLLKAVDKKDYTNVVGQLMVGYKFSVK